MAKLPIFAEGKYSDIQLAINRGLIDTAAYVFLNDVSQLAYVDTDLKIHKITCGGTSGGGYQQVMKVDTLPAPEDALEDILYIMNNIVYVFDGEMFYPQYKDYSEQINAINTEIERMKQSITALQSGNSIHANTYLEFPTIGDKNVFYVADSENATYRWDETNLKYYCIGRDYNEITEIIGGTSAIN